MAKNIWHGKYEKTFINQDEVIYLSLPLRHGDLKMVISLCNTTTEQP